MLKNLAIAALMSAAAFAVAPEARACDCEDHAQSASAAPAKADIESITVDQLAAKLEAAKQKKATVAIFDANSPETRESKGIIPTAVLLPSSSEYDLALLPKDKGTDVVFYCAAEKCGASKTAAKRALQAGYTKVQVLPAGIAGWIKAGKPTEKVAAQAPASTTANTPKT
jgi:rhodanese-related sulfurtransferase